MNELTIIDEHQFPSHWRVQSFRWIMENLKINTSENLPLLGANIHLGVTERFEGDGRAPASEDLSKYKKVEPGDIIMNPLGKPHGSIGRSEVSGITSPAYWVLRLNNSVNESSYFHYLLRSEFMIKEFIRRSKNLPPNQFDLPWENFRDISIALPKTDEQRRIADFLNSETRKIDELISLKNMQIKSYVNVQDSKINEIIWEDKNAKLIPLRYLVRCNKVSLASDTNAEYKFNYCDVGSVNYRTGISEDVDSFTFSDAPSRARRVAKKGDVVFSMVRPYLRAVAIVEESFSQYVFSTAFAVLEPTNMESEYLFEILTSTRFLAETERLSSGMGYPAINQDELLKIKIPFLDKTHQTERILQLADERRNSLLLIKTIEDSIKSLSEYKTSLVSAAVSGQFDVSDKRSVA